MWLSRDHPDETVEPDPCHRPDPGDASYSGRDEVLESAQGSAFVKPLEECELLPAFGGAPSGALRGFPYGNISNPLSTTTVPTLTG